LFLSEIQTAERMGEPDEYRVSGQNLLELERVRQILPPGD
jgi:hypothetical protein